MTVFYDITNFCQREPSTMALANAPPSLSVTLSAYLQAVQATMILATILCCISFFVFILQLFKLQQGERFLFTAIIQLLACE